MNIIPAMRFVVCEICGATKAAIMGRFRGRANGLYYLDKFRRHLAIEHGLALKDYSLTCLNIPWPRCPVTGEEVEA